PLMSRPRKCAISSPMDVLADTRPLRRFSGIGSGRLLHAVASGDRGFSILDAVDPPFFGYLRNKIETELLANDAGKKAAHRVLLPFRCSHDGNNCCTARCPQHVDDASVLGARPYGSLR